jgi:hypothetical protein
MFQCGTSGLFPNTSAWLSQTANYVSRARIDDIPQWRATDTRWWPSTAYLRPCCAARLPSPLPGAPNPETPVETTVARKRPLASYPTCGIIPSRPETLPYTQEATP